MRIIKLAVISFVILFLVLTGITILIPSDIRLSKVVNIVAPKDSIFFLIKNKEQWPRWHPSFIGADPASKVALEKIKDSVIAQTDSTLTMQWQLGNKKPLNSTWQLHRSENDNDYTLQWAMFFHSSWYPWEKLKSLFYEKQYGSMMNQGLENIKKEVER